MARWGSSTHGEGLLASIVLPFLLLVASPLVGGANPAYGCDAGYKPWMQGWLTGDGDRAEWCCQNEGKLCPTSTTITHTLTTTTETETSTTETSTTETSTTVTSTTKTFTTTSTLTTTSVTTTTRTTTSSTTSRTLTATTKTYTSTTLTSTSTMTETQTSTSTWTSTHTATSTTATATQTATSTSSQTSSTSTYTTSQTTTETATRTATSTSTQTVTGTSTSTQTVTGTSTSTQTSTATSTTGTHTPSSTATSTATTSTSTTASTTTSTWTPPPTLPPPPTMPPPTPPPPTMPPPPTAAPAPPTTPPAKPDPGSAAIADDAGPTQGHRSATSNDEGPLPQKCEQACLSDATTMCQAYLRRVYFNTSAKVQTMLSLNPPGPCEAAALLEMAECPEVCLKCVAKGKKCNDNSHKQAPVEDQQDFALAVPPLGEAAQAARLDYLTVSLSGTCPSEAHDGIGHAFFNPQGRLFVRDRGAEGDHPDLVTRLWLHFDLTKLDLPTDVIVNDAALQLHQRHRLNVMFPHTALRLGLATKPPPEHGCPSIAWDQDGIDEESAFQFGDNGAGGPILDLWHAADIATWVQDWLSGKRKNYGMWVWLDHKYSAAYFDDVKLQINGKAVGFVNAQQQVVATSPPTPPPQKVVVAKVPADNSGMLAPIVDVGTTVDNILASPGLGFDIEQSLEASAGSVVMKRKAMRIEPPCQQHCLHSGKLATCAERILHAADDHHTWGRSAACQAAVHEVAASCPDECMECTVEESSCAGMDVETDAPDQRVLHLGGPVFAEGQPMGRKFQTREGGHPAFRLRGGIPPLSILGGWGVNLATAAGCVALLGFAWKGSRHLRSSTWRLGYERFGQADLDVGRTLLADRTTVNSVPGGE